MAAGLNKASLQKRVLSALAIGPLSLFIIWYGGAPFFLLLLVSLFISINEWYGLAQKLKHANLHFLIVGSLYIGVAFYSFYLCRGLGTSNIWLLLFMVWSSDIGAYFAGKLIGGPKLIPQISPNKTWAGLVGALVSPIIILVIYFFFSHGSSELSPFLIALIIVIGALVGLIGQVGDLMMSFVKRLANVKDTGKIIPGHGGVLDRIDSLLLVTPIFYVLVKYLNIIVTIS